MGNDGNDTYVFEDGWGTDTVVERRAEGIDTLDFSTVSGNLTVEISENADYYPDVPADVVITSAGNRARGDNGVSIAEVEQIKGGTGYNQYQVNDNWFGQMTIDDSASGPFSGVLDLSNVTGDLAVSISQPYPQYAPAIMVSKASDQDDGNLITAVNVAHLVVGQGQTTISFATPNFPSQGIQGTILAPDNATGHSVVLDYTNAGSDVLINLGDAVNLANGAQSTLTMPGTPIPPGLGGGDQQQGMGPMPAVWQLVTLDTGQPFTLTFGDDAHGQHTTDLIYLFVHDPLSATSELPSALRPRKSIAGQRTAIQHALQELANVPGDRINPTVMVDGEGTLADPFVIQFQGTGLTSPVLSSDRFSVATLTDVGNVQELSLFADAGTDRTFRLTVSVNGNLQTTDALSLEFMRVDRNNLLNALNQAIHNAPGGGALNAMLTDGDGTHHDPWPFTMPNANTRIVNVDVSNPADSNNIMGAGSATSLAATRGFLQLQNTPDPGIIYAGGMNPSSGSAGQLEEWRLYITATTGAFTLSYNRGETEAIPYNATADEIEAALRELKDNANNHVPVQVQVLPGGTGDMNAPWVIQIAPQDFDFGGPPILGVEHEGDVIPADFFQGIGGGIDLEDRLQISQITGSNAHSNTIIIPDSYYLSLHPLIAISGKDNEDTIRGADTRVVNGQGGNDQLFGGENTRTLDGGAGSDELFGAAGQETLSGFVGENRLFGGPGDDTLQAGAGEQRNNVLHGDKLFGGAGNDALLGGVARDELQGGPDNDLLSGGKENDEFIFTNGWGYDVAEEAVEFRNDDTLDFSRVTENVTHVLSGGQLISGTGQPQLITDQNSLSGYTPSTGEVVVKDAFGFATGQMAVGDSNNVTLTGLQLPLDAAAMFTVPANRTLRLGVDFGDGTERVIEARIASNTGVMLSLRKVQNELATALEDAIQPLDLAGDPAFFVNAAGSKLELLLTGGPGNASKSIRVLPSASSFDSAVLVGTTKEFGGNFARFEKIVAADAKNEFLFGDDWGLIAAPNTVTSVIVPDYFVGLANFAGSNFRELEIDTKLASDNGRQVMLDFRQVTQELEFVFTKVGQGADAHITLEVGREEEFEIPGGELPFPTPPIRFAPIVVSHVDENTIIYTGRQSNTIVVNQGVDFPGTLIGSSGLKAPSAYLDPNVWFAAVSSLEVPPLFVDNVIKYTPHPTVNAELGGIGFIGAALPFAGHVDPPGLGNKAASVTGFERGTLINFFDVNNGAGFLNRSVGTHIAPTTLGLSDTFHDDYANSVADEFRSLVSTAEQLGANAIGIGGTGLLEAAIDAIVDTSANQVLNPNRFFRWLNVGVPSVMAGLTGADTYDFGGWWGLSLVVEPVDVLSATVPEFIDTLDFSGVAAPLHVTVFEATGSPAELGDVAKYYDSLPFDPNELLFSVGTNLVIVTTFDTTGLDFAEIMALVAASAFIPPLVPAPVVASILGENSALLGATADEKDEFVKGRLSSVQEFLEFGAADGGAVIANDIESIIGNELTVHFRGDFGTRPSLAGRILGSNVTLDYSDYIPDSQSDSTGIVVDAGAGPFRDWDLLTIAGLDEEDDDVALATVRELLPSLTDRYGAVGNVAGNRVLGINELIQTLSSASIPEIGGVFDALAAAADAVLTDVAVKNITTIMGSPGDDGLIARAFDDFADLQTDRDVVAASNVLMALSQQVAIPAGSKSSRRR